MPQEDWFFVRDGEIKGPISVQEVVSKVRGRVFGARTLLWREGMTGWTPLSKTDFAGLVEPERGEEPARSSPRTPSLRALVISGLGWIGERATRFRRRWSWGAAIGLLQGAALLALVSYVLLALLPVARRSRALRNELQSIAARSTLTSDTSLRRYVADALSRQGLREDECEIQVERTPGAITLRLKYVEKPDLFGRRLVLHREETVKSPTFEAFQELR